MKRILLACALLMTWSLQLTMAQNAKQEIKQTIDDMIAASLDKDLDKSMSYWDSSPAFTYIADGQQYDYQQLKDMYANFLANVENNEIIEQHITVREIGKYKAICTWSGTEKVKMKGQDAIESNWLSTLVMENKKGGWVILHGHTSHY